MCWVCVKENAGQLGYLGQPQQGILTLRTAQGIQLPACCSGLQHTYPAGVSEPFMLFWGRLARQSDHGDGAVWG